MVPKFITNHEIVAYRTMAMIEPRRSKQCVPSCVHAPCVTSTRKVTRLSAALHEHTNVMETMLTQRLDTRELRVFPCRRHVRHDILFQVRDSF